MQTPSQQQRLTALRDVIADIERKPALAEARAMVNAGDDAGFPLLGGGLVQEIFTDDPRDSGAGLGFALAQSRGLTTPRRPTIFYLHLAEDGQMLGLPYGPGLAFFGLDAARLVMVRAADMTELLWASEEVLSCRAVAALVADIRGRPKLLNFTASRRLSLRASASAVSLFLLRYGQQRDSSASHLRWRLSPERSGRHPYDDRSPGAARWRLRLEKGRVAGNRDEWMLEWTENGLVVFSNSAKVFPQRAAAPFPRPLPALLGDRLSQAG